MLFQPQQRSFGLDISDRSLKAVEFKPTLKGKLKLQALSHLDIPAGVFEDGELKDVSALTNLVEELITKPALGHFQSSYVVACLPETKTFIKMIDIPPMPAPEIPQAIKWEAEHHIPIPIEETYWDWQQVSEHTANARLPILLGVIPKAIADSYTQALSAAQLVPLALEIEAGAIVRSLLPTEASTDSAARIIIDTGASRTSLIVVDHGTIQFTVSLPISGRKVTETIATTLQLTELQAEKAKILCGLDPKKCRGALGEILKSTIDELVRRIGEAVVFYREHFPTGHAIAEVLLCGGGSNFKLIDERLSDKLNLPVKRGNPWRNLEPTPPPLKPAELIGYTTAIGLALRGNTSPNHDLH